MAYRLDHVTAVGTYGLATSVLDHKRQQGGPAQVRMTHRSTAFWQRGGLAGSPPVYDTNGTKGGFTLPCDEAGRLVCDASIKT